MAESLSELKLFVSLMIKLMIHHIKVMWAFYFWQFVEIFVLTQLEDHFHSISYLKYHLIFFL